MIPQAKLLAGMGLILALVWAPGCSEESGDTQKPAVSTPITGDLVDLRLTFEPGQKWYLEVTNDSTILRTIQGLEEKTNLTDIKGNIIEIETVNSDGSAWVKLTHDRTAVDGEDYDMNTGQKIPMKFDSSTDQGKPVHDKIKTLTSILGLSFRALLTNKGQVTEIQGLDQVYEGMMNNFGLPPGFPKDQFLLQMKQMYGVSFFAQSIEDILAHYPDEPIQVGDTWETSNETLPNIFVIERHNYSLKSKNDDIAVIEIASEISTAPQTMMDIMIQKNKTEIKGAWQSTIEIDNKTGWIKTSITKQQINRVTTTFGESADDPERKIVADVETTITVKISEIK